MPKVLVSVAPQKYLVSRIADDRIEVDVIVPSGASPHTYEPTPRQAMALQKGTLWFRIGESFENKLAKVLEKKMVIVDQRDGIELLPTCGCCHSKDGYDSHIWLSPRLLKQLASQITLALSAKFPESSHFFKENLITLHQELDELDALIALELEGKACEAMLVSHPAYAYFCRDYGLHQIAIEQEGKEPSAKQLLNILKQAKEAEIHSVLLQKQYSQKGGERIAKALGAKIILVDPYQEDVLDNLRQLASIL